MAKKQGDGSLQVNGILSAKRVNESERLASTLRESILSGELRPGERLPVEAELSSRFKVGRSTVREALRTLLSEKIVTTSRGNTGGTFVVHPGIDMVRERLEAVLLLLSVSEEVTVEQLVSTREILEIPATRSAVLRCDAEELSMIAAAVPSPESVLEVGLAYESNRDFHAMIMQASGNPLLAATAAPIFAVLRHRFLRDSAPPRFWEEVTKDHRRILAAMQDRDADAAVEEMKLHLQGLRATYVMIDARGATRGKKNRGRSG